VPAEKSEVLQAPRGLGCGEGLSPSPPWKGRDLGWGLYSPLLRKISPFLRQNDVFLWILMHILVYLCVELKV